MILSRRGIISLPVKLTVSLMVIALMVPPITALADSIQDGMDEREAYCAAEDLKDCLEHVYSRGPSYITHAELSIPSRCHLSIGGENGTSIRVFVDDQCIGQVFTGIPIDGDEVVLYGDVLMEVSNVTDGEQKVAVKEL